MNEEFRFIAEDGDDVDLGAIAEEGIAEVEGASLEPADAHSDLEPLTVAVVVGVVLALVKVVAFVIDVIRGGLEVHLDVTPHTLKRNREVPRGMVFVFLKDGKFKIEVKDEPKEALERMFGELFKLPIDATVQMAKDAIAAIKDGAGKKGEEATSGSA